MTDFEARVAARSLHVGVVGLGYVGLPAALLIAEAGFRVTGIDLREDRIAALTAGTSPIEGNEPGLEELLKKVAPRTAFSTDHAALRDADVVLVAVETPVESDHRPRYGALRAALGSLAPVLRPGALLVIESTLAPGTIDRVVVPFLEAAGRRVGEDLLVGHCPERVMPGKLLSNMRSLSRVCGGTTEDTAARMVAFYRAFVSADLDPADAVTAELTKTAENAYRDVNIAFANELALICEAVGADFAKVRPLVNKSPGRNVLLPGTGVGGHCIPKDPWLLLSGQEGPPDPAFGVIAAARRTNDAMPLKVAARLKRELEGRGGQLAGATVALLGWAYLENSDDDRNTPSAPLKAALEAEGATVRVHDPFVLPEGAPKLSLEAALSGADAVVIAVGHEAYKQADWSKVRALVLDGRNALGDRAGVQTLGRHAPRA